MMEEKRVGQDKREEEEGRKVKEEEEEEEKKNVRPVGKDGIRGSEAEKTKALKYGRVGEKFQEKQTGRWRDKKRRSQEAAELSAHLRLSSHRSPSGLKQCQPNIEVNNEAAETPGGSACGKQSVLTRYGGSSEDKPPFRSRFRATTKGAGSVQTRCLIEAHQEKTRPDKVQGVKSPSVKTCSVGYVSSKQLKSSGWNPDVQETPVPRSAQRSSHSGLELCSSLRNI